MKLPKFTTRRLLILMMLIVVYFGAWEASKREARLRNQPNGIWEWNWSSPLPLVLRKDFGDVLSFPAEYEFWFFGLFED